MVQDMYGKEYDHGSVKQGEMSLSIADLPCGVYILKVQQGNVVGYAKFIKN